MVDSTKSILPLPTFSSTSTPPTTDSAVITTGEGSTEGPSSLITDPNTSATKVLPTEGTTVVSTGSQNDDDGGFDPHVLMGITIVVVAVIAAVVVFCVVFWQRRKKRKKKVPPVLPHPDEIGATYVPSSGDTAVRFTNSPHTASRAGGLSNNISSSRDNVKIVGFRSLERNHTTALSSGLSGDDNNKDTENIYVNSEVARESAARESSANNDDDGATPVASSSTQPSEIPQEPLYVRPGSCQLPIPSHVTRNQSSYQGDDDGFESGSIDRSRLDSQKYLRPAELVLQLPALEDYPRKLSEPSTSVSRVHSMSPDKDVNIQWKAKPRVIHSAEAPARISSAYVPMVSNSGSQSPILEIHGSSRAQHVDDRKVSATTTSPKAPPNPCRSMSKDSTYININNEEANPEISQTSTPSPDHYEDVNQFNFQRNFSLYMNADECKSPTSPIKRDQQRNDPDTYTVCSFPPPSSPEKGNQSSLSDSKTIRLTTSNDELTSCDTETLDTSRHSEDDVGATRENNSYVNVAEFQKTFGTSDTSDADKASSDIQAPKLVKKPPRNTKTPSKLKTVTKDANINNKLNLNNKSKPPIAQKPTVLAKPVESKATKSSTDIGKTVTQPSLLNTKGRLLLTANSSTSTPNLTSPGHDVTLSEPQNPVKMALKPKFPRQRVKRSSSDLSKRPEVNGNNNKPNDMLTHQPETAELVLTDIASNDVGVNIVHSKARDFMKSPRESRPKKDFRHSDDQEPSSPQRKTPNFKSSLDELQIGQLDMTELKSKLKKKR